jgi:hypothetical protein
MCPLRLTSSQSLLIKLNNFTFFSPFIRYREFLKLVLNQLPSYCVDMRPIEIAVQICMFSFISEMADGNFTWTGTCVYPRISRWIFIKRQIVPKTSCRGNSLSPQGLRFSRQSNKIHVMRGKCIPTCVNLWLPKHNKGISNKTKEKISVAWVRERTIPTERPPLVGEVNANVCRLKEQRNISV